MDAKERRVGWLRETSSAFAPLNKEGAEGGILATEGAEAPAPTAPRGVAHLIRWLRDEGYALRPIAIIVGCSYDTVARTLRGEVRRSTKPSLEGFTDEMLERKHTIDRIINLDDLFNVQDAEQQGYYATLLRHLGYTKDHLRLLFTWMPASWLAKRYNSSDYEKFDYRLIGIEDAEWEALGFRKLALEAPSSTDEDLSNETF